MVLVVKNPPVNARDIRDADLILGSGRSPGGSKRARIVALFWKIILEKELLL